MAAEKVTSEEQVSRQQKESWEGWFEFIVAAILGLATLGSAWSAYQSSLWGGIQDFRIAEAHISGREAGEKIIFANQLRGIDVVLFERYVSAISENNKQLADFLFQRFRPEFRPAIDAWLATKPLKNATAPPSPFAMKEYKLAAEKAAEQLRQQEEKRFAEAREANQISDTYLLVTVLYSIVLFLGGITAAFERRTVSLGVLGLSVITLIAASIAMLFLPLAAE